MGFFKYWVWQYRKEVCYDNLEVLIIILRILEKSIYLSLQKRLSR